MGIWDWYLIYNLTMKNRLTLIFLLWLIIGFTVEIVLGQMFPERGGKDGSFYDYLLIPLPFFLFISFFTKIVFDKIKTRFMK